ncbi:MAG: xylulokinase [Spirochaetaceae bacterium]
MREETIVSDIGTGSVKSAIFGSTGELLGSAVGEYAAGSESRGEIDPEVWWTAFTRSLSALGEVRSLSDTGRIILTGQMQNLILLDSEGRPVAPAILYFDARGEGELETLFERVSRSRIVEITGNTPDGAGFPGKLLSVAERTPELIERTETVLCGAHDYVAYRLTGVARSDRTTAGTTGLLDLSSGSWSAELIEAVPIDPANLPEVCFAQSSDGVIEGDLARELGLPEGVELLHGAGDVGASVLASELSGGRVGCYLGTSGWVLDEAAPDRRGDPELGVFNLPHPSKERIVRVAPLLTAAGAAEWFLSLLSEDPDERSRLYEELGRVAAERDEPTGIVFLPHLAGERSPFKDPEASGVFLGLRREDGRAKLFRAVLEGVSCAIRSVLEPLSESREETTELLLSGGGGQIRGWPEILAEVTGLPVRIAGDARFAGGRGMLSLLDSDASVPGASGAEQRERVVGPPERRRYEAQYETFRKVYPRLRELMHELRDAETA